MVEALLDVSLLALFPDALAEVAGSGIGAGAVAVCEAVVSVGACAVVGSADAGVDGVVGIGVDGAVTATSLETLDVLGSGSFTVLVLLLADAVTLFELDAWREALVSFAVSFAGLPGFSVTVDCDSTGAAGFAVSAVVVTLGAVSVFASLTVDVEFEATAVSATLARGFAVFALTSGLGSWPTLWSSTTAPPMATAVMTPKAMPKWFTFFSSWL